jgi:hypothetical protein
MNNQDELRHRYLMNRRAFVGMAVAGDRPPAWLYVCPAALRIRLVIESGSI